MIYLRCVHSLFFVGNRSFIPRYSSNAFLRNYDLCFVSLSYFFLFTSQTYLRKLLFYMHIYIYSRACDLNLHELRKLDASEWFGAVTASAARSIESEISTTVGKLDVSLYTDKQRKIAYFGDVLTYCRANNIWMNVEIKPAEGYDTETGRIVAQYTKAKFELEIKDLQESLNSFQFVDVGRCITNLPLLSSFSFEALMAAKTEAPELPRAFLIKDLEETVDWREKMIAVGAVALHTDAKNLSESLAREIKSLGYGLFCYTVNDRKDADRLTDWGVDSFCTDQLDMFATLSKKKMSRNLLSELLEKTESVDVKS